jgi:hypothetical protein
MELEPGQRRAALRASDADREQIVSALRQHHSEGRLTVDEFTERMQHAFGAKTFGELDPLTRDLPPILPPLPEPLGSADPAMVARHRFYRHLLGYAWTNAFLVLVWMLSCLATTDLLFFWPLWTLLGWGLALGFHAIRAFGPQDDGPDRNAHWSSDPWSRDPWSGDPWSGDPWSRARGNRPSVQRWSGRHRSRSHISR